ncbi:hypothetical protein [Oceanobacillus picturae]|uniref:hypothetical protein n=1 Tax=Oceanobacillus picturae TaxID=171693 RepID=UPI00362DE8A6
MITRKVTLLIIVSLFALLTACNSEPQQGYALIKKGELTEYERSLTDLVSETFFIYDVEFLNENAKEVRLKVDYYQEGELVDTIVDFGTSIKEKKSRFVLLNTPYKDKEKWNAAVITEDGMTSLETDPMDSLSNMDMTVSSVGMDETELKIGEKTIIASIVKSNQENISIPTDIDSEEDLIEVTAYEHAFLVSATLMDCHIGDEGCPE